MAGKGQFIDTTKRRGRGGTRRKRGNTEIDSGTGTNQSKHGKKRAYGHLAYPYTNNTIPFKYQYIHTESVTYVCKRYSADTGHKKQPKRKK